MSAHRYHHGDLRAALLTQAEDTLRESGVDGLSLRELARTIGVSHAAPRRHFEDKASLLEALVADGFRRLQRALEPAANHQTGDLREALTAVAAAHVRFATSNPALTDLMSSSRYLAEASDALIEARETAYAPVLLLLEQGQRDGQLAAGDVRRFGTLIFATVHGLATLATNGMIDPVHDGIIDDAVSVLLAGLAALPD